MNRSHATYRHAVAAAVLAAAGALVTGSAARADFPFPPTPRELHQEVRGLVHDVLRTLDRIPVEIHGEFAGDLDPFLVGNVYFAPHRHMHVAYSFPVWIDGAVYYRPYVYCNHRLYGDYGARPQFWSGWGVASQGSWCGHHHAYYPTSHACFRPQHRSYFGSDHHSGYPSQYRSDAHAYSAPRPDSRYDSRYGSHNGSRHDSRYDGYNGSHGRSNDAYRSGSGSDRGRGYGSHDGDRSRNGKHPSQDRKGHDGRGGRDGGDERGRNRH